MQTLNLHRPDMPDLQFVLLVTALCTSRLTTLNIPNALRTTIFDRCWVLIHDSPPPRRPEARVLDLRPWTEMTVEAMAETIRAGLTEAGIHTLAWDHAPSQPAHSSTPATYMFIDRLSHLFPHLSDAKDAASGEVVEETGARQAEKGPDVLQLLGEMAALMAKLAPALERSAADLRAGGKTGKLVDTLQKGAELMHGSESMFLAWARYYAEPSDKTAL
ncbi:MAG TPA: hypothetical protein VLA67_00835 [Nitrospiraceae bacterium]|nr:hypothetical protein [Nitrospira sp.]HSF65954.1 hypothetical protein [Nitrospiraceae bacterium]